MTNTPENFSASDSKTRQDLLFLAGVCLAAALLLLPVFLNGVPKGNDLPQHFQFAVTVYDALQNGDYYPAWMPNENHGYGGIGLRFYPPVPYYALAAGKMLTGNWFAAAELVFWFWLALSGVGAYLWARERFAPGASFVAALGYMAAPYHINELYNAFTYAEFAAVALLPFCFLFIDRVVREKKLLNITGLAACYALFVMCNLPIAVMGTLSMGVYCLVSLPRREMVFTAVRLAGGFLLGAALCSFFWIKIVTEMAWLNHSAEGYSSASVSYDYKVNFLLRLKYLATLSFDERDMWFADLMLLATVLLFIPLLIVFWNAGGPLASKKLWRVVILFLFALFMATPLSTPVWEYISPIQKIQFPWRFLAIVTVSGVPMAAAGWSYCWQWMKGSKRPLALIVFGCLLFGVVFTWSQVIKQANYYTREEFEPFVATLGEAANFDCWFTVWAKEDAMKTREAFLVPGREMSSMTWMRNARYFHFSKGEAVRARVATFYYPYWKVWVNDAPVEAFPAEDGALSFDLPPDAVNATVRFEEPARIAAARIFSLACWIATALATLFLLLLRIRVRTGNAVTG